MGNTCPPTASAAVRTDTTNQPIHQATQNDCTRSEYNKGEEVQKYEDDSDEANEETEEYEAPWLTEILEKLDKRWESRWS